MGFLNDALGSLSEPQTWMKLRSGHQQLCSWALTRGVVDKTDTHNLI